MPERWSQRIGRTMDFASDNPIGHEMCRNEYRLLSTGRIMKYGDEEADLALCYWVEGGKLHFGAFSPDELEIAELEADDSSYLGRLRKIEEEHNRQLRRTEQVNRREAEQNRDL